MNQLKEAKYPVSPKPIPMSILAIYRPMIHQPMVCTYDPNEYPSPGAYILYITPGRRIKTISSTKEPSNRTV